MAGRLSSTTRTAEGCTCSHGEHADHNGSPISLGAARDVQRRQSRRLVGPAGQQSDVMTRPATRRACRYVRPRPTLILLGTAGHAPPATDGLRGRQHTERTDEPPVPDHFRRPVLPQALHSQVEQTDREDGSSITETRPDRLRYSGPVAV